MPRDNAPPPDGWCLPPRHCGVWCDGRCQHDDHLTIPANITLGTE